MSAARRKGNALELALARRMRDLDGTDARLSVLETLGGRLGSTYALQIDVATRRFACEAKNREDLPRRLWDWLDGLKLATRRLQERLGDPAPKVPLLVLKRNHRRPLVVLDLEDFEQLVRVRRPGVDL